MEPAQLVLAVEAEHGRMRQPRGKLAVCLFLRALARKYQLEPVCIFAAFRSLYDLIFCRFSPERRPIIKIVNLPSSSGARGTCAGRNASATPLEMTHSFAP